MQGGIRTIIVKAGKFNVPFQGRTMDFIFQIKEEDFNIFLILIKKNLVIQNLIYRFVGLFQSFNTKIDLFISNV